MDLASHFLCFGAFCFRLGNPVAVQVSAKGVNRCREGHLSSKEITLQVTGT
jgi:hypothetical protein